jgi:hypothetical protein
MVKVRGSVASGDVPVPVCQEIATATTYEWLAGICAASDVMLAMGYAVTVVPVGRAPAGTVTMLVVLVVERVMVVGDVGDAVPEIGVPNDDDVTPLGGGAFVGPTEVVTNGTAVLGSELL